MQEQTITALCAALTAQQLPFAQGEPLAPHTTFKIGGPAAFWCTPRDAEQLRRTLQLCRENGVRVYLLGNGSNTLFDDAGFDGAVIDMRGLSGMENSGLDTDAVRITAGAGQTLGRLCSKAQTLGLTCLEPVSPEKRTVTRRGSFCAVIPFFCNCSRYGRICSAM